MQTHKFHIESIIDVIREGTLRWLGHVIMRREPHSMLHEFVKHEVKGTRPRGWPIEQMVKPPQRQGFKHGVMFQSMENTLSELTWIHMHNNNGDC